MQVELLLSVPLEATAHPWLPDLPFHSEHFISKLKSQPRVGEGKI